MKKSKSEIMQWEKRFRLKFINSISGYKGVHLIGTKNGSGKTNLAIFNSIVHIGSTPPLIGFIMRPLTAERNTYANIVESKYYTINHVHRSFLEQAHYTSAKFDASVSEFDTCNLTAEYSNNIQAPYVKESNIKLGLRLVSDTEIEQNGTRLIIGEVEEVIVDDTYVEEDGQIDLELAKDICVTGLNQYSTVTKSKKIPYARVPELPNFYRKKRPDNVVFDEENQSYNANILPYGTNIGAPNIEPTGLSTWINTSVNSFNHSFNNKVELIKSEYQSLINEYEVNDLIYKASMSFEPIIGKEYHLYFSNKNGGNFLSLISPDSWKMEYLGSYTLNNDKTWKKLNNEPK
ncbi:MAG: flavin reductase (DIM6/NTAB) family NADH-FMN oxidoreductase RutF [Sphingobacteriales bacterium]|jgi:flavin reductase (DIM6/NTAB) family NADH-FMN oxidoreductase RutF